MRAAQRSYAALGVQVAAFHTQHATARESRWRRPPAHLNTCASSLRYSLLSSSLLLSARQHRAEAEERRAAQRRAEALIRSKSTNNPNLLIVKPSVRCVCVASRCVSRAANFRVARISSRFSSRIYHKSSSTVYCILRAASLRTVFIFPSPRLPLRLRRDATRADQSVNVQHSTAQRSTAQEM